jgi:hypothetical protein
VLTSGRFRVGWGKKPSVPAKVGAAMMADSFVERDSRIVSATHPIDS